jgi:hypothetical protein
MLGQHDSRGPLSGWRAIFDAGEALWDFHDAHGRHCLPIALNQRPSPEAVDFVAAVFERGYAIGRREAEPPAQALARVWEPSADGAAPEPAPASPHKRRSVPLRAVRIPPSV